MIREAIILAGGLGTRLRSAVPDLPKCMAPVNAKPFVSYVIDYYLGQGIEHFIFALGYRHEIITQYLNTQYARLDADCVIEHEALGTGGAIRLACDKVRGGSVLALNGDTLFKINTGKLSSFHEDSGAECTLSLKPMKAFDRYGSVEVDEEGRITAFREKRFLDDGLINGGVYALDAKRFLARELPEKFSFESQYLERFSNEGILNGIIQDEYFIDIGIPEDFERVQLELRHPSVP